MAYINVPDSGPALVGTVVGTLDGVTVEIQGMVLADPTTPDNQLKIDTSGRVDTKRSSAFTTSQVSVGIAATSIASSDNTREEINIKNGGSDYLWIGPAGVTSGSGFLIEPGETWVKRNFTGAVYGLAGVTLTVYVQEFTD